MNPERMRAVADAIEQSGRFDYSSWACIDDSEDDLSTTNELKACGTLRHCGTSGCIAGWAATVALGEDEALWGRRNMMISDMAEAYLDLTGDQAHTLFLGQAMVLAGFYESDGEALGKATAIEAAKVLRMAADGEVVL